MDAALRGFKEEERLAPLRPVQAETIPAVSMEERMAQFQQFVRKLRSIFPILMQNLV